MPGLVFDIPGALVALDSDAYPAGGGTPSSSHLGRSIARNDRQLHATLRRSFAWALPATTPWTCCDLIGLDLGPIPWDLTQGCRRVAWYFRGTIPAGMTVYATAYTVGYRDPQPYRHIDAVGSGYLTMAGAGVEASHGPLYCTASPGCSYGAVIWSTDDGSLATGQVIRRDVREIEAAASGAFAGLPTPPAAVIALTDGVGGALLSSYYQITAVASSGLVKGGVAAVNDIARVFPGISERDYMAEPTPGNVLGYIMRACTTMTLYSWLLREVPLAGTLASEP